MDDPQEPPSDFSSYFMFFNEIGIIAQLSRALLEARLPDGMTVPQYSVLNHLVRVSDGRTPLELASAFQVPKTSMTHTLNLLTRRGLVEMRSNPKDGRSKQVWLTPAGRAFRETAILPLGKDISRLAREISPEKIARLVPELAEIRKVLDADRN